MNASVSSPRPRSTEGTSGSRGIRCSRPAASSSGTASRSSSTCKRSKRRPRRSREANMAKKLISVVGGTGLQGGGVVNALLAQGTFDVRVATRNPESDRARALSARGVQVVKADLLEPTTMVAAFAGAHGAFVVTSFWDPGVGARETEIGRAAVEAARRAGVEHLVWSTLPDVENITRGRLKVVHFT